MIQVIYEKQTYDKELVLVNFFDNCAYWQFNGESSVYKTKNRLINTRDLLLIEFLTDFGKKNGWEFVKVVS